MKFLLPYLKPYRFHIVFGPLCKLIEAIIDILLPTLLAFMIDQGVLQNNKEIILRYGIIMLALSLVGYGFSLICQYLASVAAIGVANELRKGLYAHILQLRFVDIDTFSSTSLANRLSHDVLQIQNGIALMIRLLIRAPFIILGSLVMAMYLHFTLSLILIFITPLIAFGMYLFIKKSNPLYDQYQKALDTLASMLADRFQGIRVIRAFLMQGIEKRKIRKQIDQLQSKMNKIANLATLLNPFHSLIVNFSILALLWMGAQLMLTNQMQPGIIIALINYATQILVALVASSTLIIALAKANTSIARIRKVFLKPINIHEGTLNHVKKCSCAIQFEHVCFAHGESRVLHDISFSINTGEKIGIIGGIGAGKSSIAYLLAHFYEISAGSLKLYETAIADYGEDTLAQIVSIAPQKVELFQGSILDNVTMKKTYPLTQIQKALIDAQASGFVEECEGGLQHHLDEGGQNLSGGQRARLSIARTLLRNTPIVIFDDIGSALDYKIESLLRQALKTYEQQTQIFISQRVPSLLHCDRILVLDQGECKGYASHEELLKTCPIYQEICESQQISEESLCK